MIETVFIIVIVLIILEIIYFIFKYIKDKSNWKKGSIFNLIIKIIWVWAMILMWGWLFLIFYFIYWCGNQF